MVVSAELVQMGLETDSRGLFEGTATVFALEYCVKLRNRSVWIASNPVHYEYKCGTVPLHHPARLVEILFVCKL